MQAQDLYAMCSSLLLESLFLESQEMMRAKVGNMRYSFDRRTSFRGDGHYFGA